MTIPLRKQHTLADAGQLTGVGYWSGREVTLSFRPGPPDSGVVFVRQDLPGKPRIAASLHNRQPASRRTNLFCQGAGVEMVEHVLAALAGLQIDNCEVWTDAAEMPGCDGSSLAFVETLAQAGRVEQDAWRERLTISQEVQVGDERAWVQARPAGAGATALRLRYELDYSCHPAIGRQTLDFMFSVEAFVRQLASSRTFLLMEEAAWLRAQGVGGHVTNQDLLVFDETGPIDNPLRFPDECVRHKTLDVLGDLALLGCDLALAVTAHRSGHQLNAALARALQAQGLRRAA